MTKPLLALLFLWHFVSVTCAQNCTPQPGQLCEEAPLFCGFKLHNYQGTSDGFTELDHWPFCSNIQNNQFIKFIACSNKVNIVIMASNCQNGDGLQAAIYADCHNMLVCEQGMENGANTPINLNFTADPGETYTLMIDGYGSDICDFRLLVQGVDISNPKVPAITEKGVIKYTPVACGAGTLELQLPNCAGSPTPGCSKSFAESYKEKCLKFDWVLPAGVKITSSDPNAQTINIAFENTVTNGAVEVNLMHTCPGIDPVQCADCLPGCCSPDIDPITISGFFWEETVQQKITICDDNLPYLFHGQTLTEPGTYKYTSIAPNGCPLTEVLHFFVSCCKNKNPNFSDACADAPLLCADYIKGKTFHFLNSTADVPGNLASEFCFPINGNRWLRFAACDPLVTLIFNLKNCTPSGPAPGGMEVALFSATNCQEYSRIGNCLSIMPNTSVQNTYSGLVPGETYYIMVDGIGNSSCEFEIDPLSGINDGKPNNLVTTGEVKDGSTNGPNVVCPGQTVTYTATPPSCKVTLPVFECPLPKGACLFCGTGVEIEKYIYKWHIPKCARIIGDSNSASVTLVFDQCTFDKDTVVNDSIWFELLPVYSDTVFISGDTLVFCDCVGANVTCGKAKGLGIKIIFDVENIELTIPCDGPPPEFMGTIYAAPGTFVKNSADGCKRWIIKVKEDKAPQFTVDVEGILTCAVTAVPVVISTQKPALFGLGGQVSGEPKTQAVYFISSPGQTLFSVSAANGKCKETGSFWVPIDVTQPIVTAMNDFEACASETAKLSASAWPQNCIFSWSPLGNGPTPTIDVVPGKKTYTVTATNPFNGCTNTDKVVVNGLIPSTTKLAPLFICPGDCVNLPWGETICSPGVYQEYFTSYKGCDSLVIAQVVSKSKISINLGTVGVLTCAKPVVTFKSKKFNSPGTFVLSGNCVDTTITIIQNIKPPSVSISGDKSICAGESISLSCEAPDGILLLWSDGTQGKQLNAQPTQSGTFSVVATDPANGCSAEASISVEVNPKTQLDLGVVGTLNCATKSVTVAGKEYAQPGKYGLSGACADTSFVIAQDIKVPQLSISGDKSICVGESISLSCEAPDGLLLLWSDGTQGKQLNAQPTQSGTFSVVATDPINGCSAEASISVEVMPKTQLDLGVVGTLNCATKRITVAGKEYAQPGKYGLSGACADTSFVIAQDIKVPQLSITGDKSICVGESISLSCEAPDGILLLWSDGTQGKQLNAQPTQSGTFSVVATDPVNGCSAEASISVEVNPKTQLDLGVVGTLNCATKSVTVAGKEYAQPGKYGLTGACADTSFVIAQDIKVPQLSISGDKSICAGESISLSCEAPDGLLILWSEGTQGKQLNAQPTQSGTFSVVATDPVNGCSAEASISVEVNPKTQLDLGVVGTLNCATKRITVAGKEYAQPGKYGLSGACADTSFVIAQDIKVPQLSISGDKSICAGESISLSCEAPDGILLLWSDGTQGKQLNAQPTQSGTFSVVATDPVNGCSAEASISVEVMPKTQLDLGVVGTLNCATKRITVAGKEYAQPGKYGLSGACADTSFVIAQDIKVPQLSITGDKSICVGESISLSCEAPDGILLLWSDGTQGKQLNAQPTQSGTFSVVATDPVNGCSAEASISVEVNPKTQLDLGVVGTLTCATKRITVAGKEYAQPGKYGLSGACADTSFVIAQDIKAPQLSITGDNSICAGESISLSCEAPDGVLLLWSDGTQGKQLNAQPTQSGTFSVVATDPANGCSAEASISVEVNPKTQLDLGVVGTLNCATKSVTVAGKEYTQPGIYVISESCSDSKFQIIQNTSLPEVALKEECDSQKGWYQIHLTVPQNATYAIDGRKIQDGSWKSEWMQGGAAYRFNISDLVNGCSVELIGEVACEKVEGHYFVPNIFKPGSAGENGWFTIYGSTEHIRSIQVLQIFDRWGDKVFERKDFAANTAELGWDGKQKGMDAPPSVFVFRAALLLSDGTTKWLDGNVTLIR